MLPALTLERESQLEAMNLQYQSKLRTRGGWCCNSVVYDAQGIDLEVLFEP